MSDPNNGKDDIDNDLDLEGGDFADDGGFDDFNGKQGTLGDLWRNNPMVKIGVILAAFAFIVGGVILFGGQPDTVPVSRVVGSTDLSEAPGTSEITQAYREAIEEENTRRVEEALRQQESAVPTPVEAPKGRLPLQVEESQEEDPLERWRRMQEERIQQQQITTQSQPQAVEQVDTRTPAVNALSQAMVTQMEAVLENQPIRRPQSVNITSTGYLDMLEEQRRLEQEQMRQAAGVEDGAQDEDVVNILIPAGTIEYGQLITEANTDAPGPVLAQIVSGPLRGARVLGGFEATDEYITLTFNQVVIDGISQAANAVAIDPDTTLPGMVTEIDHKYFTRIVLPAAAAFVEGLTEAISESGSTTIFIEGDTVAQSSQNKSNREEVASGISEAGEVVAELMEEEADRAQPMLRIRNGTPIGIMFVEPVLEEEP